MLTLRDFLPGVKLTRPVLRAVVLLRLVVKKIDDKTCEFTNMVHSSATPELMDFLGKQAIPFEVFQAGAWSMSRVTCAAMLFRHNAATFTEA